MKYLGIAAAAITLTVGGAGADAIPEKTLSVGTASQGGAWYSIAARMVQDLEAAVPGLVTQVQPGGAISNVKKLNEGAIDLGITPDFVGGLAYKGEGPFDEELTDFVYLAKLFPGYTQIFTVKSSNIQSLDDLEKSRVTAGKNGWASEQLFRMMLEANGKSYDSIREAGGVVNFVATGQATQMMRDGNLDAMFITGNPPVHPAFRELALTTEIDILDLGDDALGKTFAAYPFLSSITMPEDIYDGVETGFDTIGGNVLLMARRDLSDEAAYEIVKAFYDNLDTIKADVPMLDENTLDSAVQGVPVDIHPGAIRYYKEKGLM